MVFIIFEKMIFVMTFNKKIYGKDCRSYSFTWIFAESINIDDCLKRVKENFQHFIGLDSVSCDWKPRDENGQFMISGIFDALGKKQNQLNHSLLRHDCGDFPMGYCPIERIR